MRTKALKVLIVIALLSSVHFGTADSIGDKPDNQTEVVVVDKDRALEKAIQYGGFEKVKAFDRRVHLDDVASVILHDNHTPFLAGRIDGQPGWQVEFKGISLTDAADESDSLVVETRDFRVFLDSIGTFVKAVSERSGFDESYWRKPPAEIAEEQLRKHRERYLDFVRDAPDIHLLAALEAARRFQPRCLSAQQIVARCVVFLYQDEPPRPVWDIHVYGVANILATDPVRPAHHTDHMRILIDATTGAVIFADNLPHPTE